jgi:S-adenosylmethionine synthetase
VVQHLTVPQAFAVLLIEPDGRRVVAGQTFDSGLAGSAVGTVQSG